MKIFSLVALKVVDGEPDPTKGLQVAYPTREQAEQQAVHIKETAAKDGVEIYTDVTEQTLH